MYAAPDAGDDCTPAVGERQIVRRLDGDGRGQRMVMVEFGEQKWETPLVACRGATPTYASIPWLSGTRGVLMTGRRLCNVDKSVPFTEMKEGDVMP